MVSSVAITSLTADTLFSVGDEAQITAVARDASGTTFSGATITWTSSNPAVASVAPSTGATVTLVAVANGSATVTASSASATASRGIVVSQRAAAMTIIPAVSDSIFSLGESRTLSASVRDARGSAISGALVQWSVDKTSVATLSSAAGATTVATAVGNGTAIVTARSGVLTASAGVPVRQKAVQLAVSPTTVSVALGATATLAVAPRDGKGNGLSGLGPPRFATSDAAIARVSDQGVVTGVAAGSATVTVAMTTPDGELRASVPVTVGSFASTAAVDVEDNQFTPGTVDIVAGGRVTWTWKGGASHDVRGTGAANPIAGPLQSQGTYVLAFPTPGRFTYICTQHAGMGGTIVVH